MQTNDLINFDFDFDKDRLLAQANILSGYQPFIDTANGCAVKGWLIKQVSEGYGLEISNFLKDYFHLTDCRPRFYIQEAGISIPFHKDRGTLCSFNFLLSDDLDPISFRHRTITYKTAVLNTSIDHAVFNPKNKRVLFKVSVFDKSFQEIINVLPSKLQLR
jgi:hypothetical protein